MFQKVKLDNIKLIVNREIRYIDKDIHNALVILTDQRRIAIFELIVEDFPTSPQNSVQYALETSPQRINRDGILEDMKLRKMRNQLVLIEEIFVSSRRRLRNFYSTKTSAWW